MKRSILLLAFLLPLYLLAQESGASTLKGRIVNDANTGVPFASITVKGTSVGTASDSTGYFSLITSQKFPFTVVVSSVGFAPLNFVVRNKEVHDVVLQLQSLFQNTTC